MNNILLLNNTSKLLLNTTNKIDSFIQAEKQKAANKYFENNKYIQDYIKNFYNNFEAKYFDETGDLCHYNSFDFTQIPEYLHDNLKDYMQAYHCLYYQDNGFCITSFDNIYISYDNEIFADFMNNNIPLYTDNELELFTKIELLQAEHGIYPEVVYLDYYGQYKKDYTIPDDFKFLKTGMKQDKKDLIFYLKELADIYKYTNETIYYDYNSIIEQFTPDFIKKIHYNLTVDITNISLDDDFNLTMTYIIPVKLKLEQLKKLNITNYNINSKYRETHVTITVNIKEWLQDKIN